jgi:uncharacterized iron-regulated membrane protein
LSWRQSFFLFCLEKLMTSLSLSRTPTSEKAARLYRMLWRWHFYAGLFCIPFIIILSLTGATYLFKTQIEAAFDAPYNNLASSGPAQPVSAQVQAALSAFPDSTLKSYRLPQEANDAAQIIITRKGADMLAYVDPASLQILKAIPSEDRFMAIVRTIHGELLMGDNGSLIVELAASWALVMVVTGLYLWWPRNVIGLAGVVWPRVRHGSKVFWRDLHALTGLWVSFFAVFLLLSGLPWTNVWGDGFKKVREATGTAAVTQDWSSGRSSEHADMTGGGENAHAHHLANPVYTATIDDIAASARAGQLQPPVVLFPPSAKNPNWRAVSQTQNRPLGATLTFGANDGSLLKRATFADRHPIDQAIGIGIAAHEGALFGPLNQIIGLFTALGLVTLCVSAFVLWRKRAPDGVLGTPPPIPDQKIGIGIGTLILAFAIFLPVLGISLVAIALLERLILTRLPAARVWLGLEIKTKAHVVAP